MSVHYDDKYKYWYVRKRIKTLDGQVVKKKLRGFKTKKEAKIAEHNLDILSDVNYKKIYIKDLIIDYENYLDETKKPNTIITHKNKIKNHITPYFNNKKLDDLNINIIRKFKIELTNNNPNLSIQYKNDILHILGALINFANKYHDFKYKSRDIIETFPNHNPIKKIEYLTYEEWTTFKSNITRINDLALFTIFYFTGVRKGEIQALTWNDWKEDEKSLIIFKNYSAKKQEITSTKTSKSTRTILLDDNSNAILIELFKAKKEYPFFSEKNYIFGNLQPLSATQIDRLTKKYLLLSGINKHITAHTFRHSHASLLINKGVNITVISKRLGHSDITTTLDVYSHMFPSAELEAIDILNNLL